MDDGVVFCRSAAPGGGPSGCGPAINAARSLAGLIRARPASPARKRSRGQKAAPGPPNAALAWRTSWAGHPRTPISRRAATAAGIQKSASQSPRKKLPPREPGNRSPMNPATKDGNNHSKTVRGNQASQSSAIPATRPAIRSPVKQAYLPRSRPSPASLTLASGVFSHRQTDGRSFDGPSGDRTAPVVACRRADWHLASM